MMRRDGNRCRDAARLMMIMLAGVAALAWAPPASAGPEVGVSPVAINFGSVPRYGGCLEKVVVVNVGDADAHLDIAILGDDLRFEIARGGGPRVLPAGERHVVWVRFSSGMTVGSTGGGELFVSGDAPRVQLRGYTSPADGPCIRGATDIDFDQVSMGETLSFSIPLTNFSSTSQVVIEPYATNPAFRCSPERINLWPQTTLNLVVTYAPTEVGADVGSIILNQDQCTPITVRGECPEPTLRTEDLVGLWLDEALTVGISEAVTAGEPFDVWLAMLNPSEPVGVGGWELQLDLDANTYVTDVHLEGLSYNILNAPEFFVGLAEPLPWGEQVILARLELTVLDQEWHVLGLKPISRPSLPGALAWAYGDDYAIKPLYRTTGVPAVAWFRASTTVAVTAPTPTAVLADGRIELAWPLPADGSEGCHVYRAVDGDETRLTAAPLPPAGGGYRFVDDAAGLPAGATAAYSYAVLRGGVEIARSAAVEIDLPGTAALATRLLPNRPNPFNPETEIHFTLARAGQARVAVYDIGGRRVAVLADGVQEAGAHHVTWRGRDDAGRTLPSGSYYVRLETAQGQDTRKVMLLK